MIAETLRRLEAVAPLDEFRYVGLGALHFVDFILFHRVLGIHDMVSIERDSANRSRYLFNRPFRTVDLRFGHSRDVLPQLEWDGLRIVWLDYDGQLTQEVLRDTEYLAQRLLPASVLIVTLNGHAKFGGRLETLRENIGHQDLAVDLTEEALQPPWAFAEEQYRVLSRAFLDALGNRSDAAAGKQLFNFRYRDGARMQTVGWIVTAPNVAKAVDSCDFGHLEFVREGSTAYDLSVPPLTRRELEHLSQLVPTQDEVSLDWLGADDFNRYAALYRWYPQA